jgi:hypothetical protein
MKPPSSDAEPLRDQQTAQVRAANGLFVAADEFGNLERRHQSIRQAAAPRRAFTRGLCDFRMMLYLDVRVLSHGILQADDRDSPHRCD